MNILFMDDYCMELAFSHPRVGGGARSSAVGGGQWNA